MKNLGAGQETFFSSFSLNTGIAPTPTSACSWAGRKGAASCPGCQASWSQDHGTDNMCVQVFFQVTSTLRVLTLCPCPAAISFGYNCLVSGHCQVEVSAASFWKRLNCCRYLSVKCISLCWKATGDTALVQIGNGFQINERPQQGLSNQEGSC